jgi:hypothetical protein
MGIHFTVGISCEIAAPLAEKNAAALHHILRSLISPQNEHPIYIYIYIADCEISKNEVFMISCFLVRWGTDVSEKHSLHFQELKMEI